MDDILTKISTLEAEIEKQKEALTALRKSLPPMRVADVTMTDMHGQSVTLSDLFDGRKDLIVIHNMGQACAYCTLWADGLNGLLPHLLTRTSVVMCSPDSPEPMRAFSESRGWNYRMISTQGSTFTKDVGFADSAGGTNPGYSTFRKNADGTIDRLSFAYFGPGDDYCGIWFMLPLLDDGIAGWSPKHVTIG